MIPKSPLSDLQRGIFANYSRMVMFLFFLVLSGCSTSRSIVFPRHVIPQDAWRDPPPDAEVLWIETSQGPVEAWILPGRGVHASAPGPAVLFAHGNAELIDGYPPRLQPYRDAGITVMLCEYRGYGRSAGSPSEKHIVEDFVKFRNELVRRDDVDEDRIVYHGRSLCGGVVCALMKKHRPAAIILQSTFSSLKDLANDHNTPAWLLADEFESRTALKEQYEGPLLVLHGRRDTVIHFYHASALASVVENSRVVAFDTDHNEPFPEEYYWQAIFDFLKKEKLLSHSATGHSGRPPWLPQSLSLLQCRC